MGAVVLDAGRQRAEVRTRGAALVAYEVDGRPVVVAPSAPDGETIGYAGEVLVPWPNRVAGGRLAWAGEHHQLEITEPATGNTLHGLATGLAWAVVDHRPDAVRLETDVGPAPGWPFRLRCAAAYRLGPDGLTAAVEALNTGGAPCPYGAGVHPYLALPGGAVDDAVLRLPVSSWLAVDGRMLPTGRHPVAGTPYDLSGDERLGGRSFDTAFTGLPAGGSEARVRTPDGGAVVVWGDETVRWWQVYTCDGLPEPWRRAALAVEPMTCPPDAFTSGVDVVVLEPGGAHVMTWGVRAG